MAKIKFKRKENVEKKAKKSRKIGKRIALGILITFLTAFLAGMVFIGVQIANAPDISEIDAAPDGYLTTVLDKDENVMKNLYIAESNRVYVTLDVIPMHLQKAFIAIEDARFYKHFGIDIKGILRATFLGIKNGFKFSQGASTLTQQLLKNNVFESWMSEVTLLDRVERKIQEQYLAIRLEQKYDKDWILENYLNTINLGGGTRGVQVAAQYYFGKDVSQLTLGESSLIAGITKNPTRYNPLNNPEKSVARQELVLEAMLKEGYISQQELDAALAENVLSHLNTNSENRGMQIFSWFEDTLIEQIVEDLMVEYNCTQEDAWDAIYTGGLTIYSTQDTNLQRICEAVATDKHWYRDNEEISVVMMDVSTGAVAAIIGGSEAKTNSLVYNRATDAIRQPGSTIKVIGEFAAAMDLEQINLASVLDDAPYTYTNGTAIRNSYDTYKGMITIREAVASSSNVVALKAFQMVGMDNVFGYLQKFGITTLTDADKNEAIAIGGTYNGVTNLEMTAAYNAIANDGSYTKPFYYTKVVDREGNVILENIPQYEQVIKPNTAALLTCAMQEVLTSGTGVGAAVSGYDLAGKSGTTNESKDLWFVGYSSYYTCGIWGGYDSNAAQTNTGYVKQIWQEIMRQAHEGKENIELVDKDMMTSVKICTKCGKKAYITMCTKTLQGDMTADEYFIKGTEPTTSCDCHTQIKICKSSGMQLGVFCPRGSESIVTNVYLKRGTEGTADYDYAVTEKVLKSCIVHTSFWEQWFNKDPDEPNENDNSNNNNNPDNDNDSDNDPDNDSNNNDNENPNEEPTKEPERPNDGGGNWFHDFLNGLFG